jgi:hypothetical protein
MAHSPKAFFLAAFFHCEAEDLNTARLGLTREASFSVGVVCLFSASRRAAKKAPAPLCCSDSVTFNFGRRQRRRTAKTQANFKAQRGLLTS